MPTPAQHILKAREGDTFNLLLLVKDEAGQEYDFTGITAEFIVGDVVVPFVLDDGEMRLSLAADHELFLSLQPGNSYRYEIDVVADEYRATWVNGRLFYVAEGVSDPLGDTALQLTVVNETVELSAPSDPAIYAMIAEARDQILAVESNAVLEFKGDWDPDTYYLKHDTVRFNSAQWTALVPNKGVTPEDGDTWKFLIRDGIEAYVYIAYADDDQGTGFSLVDDGTKTYVGFLSTTEPITPTAEHFEGKWSRLNGESATITLAPTITGLPGTNAIVENLGTPLNAQFRFTIPRGDVGPRPDHEWSGTMIRFQNAAGEWGEWSNLVGPPGVGLPPDHRWTGTSLQFQNPDGSWGVLVDLKGVKGDPGSPPAHRWIGTALQFQNPDGSWADAVELKGAAGDGSGDMLAADYDTDGDFKVNAAETADSVPWAGVTGKPTEYTPAAHTHALQDVTGLVDALAGKAPTDHQHDEATTVAAGFLSAADKAKLDGIEAGATADQSASEVPYSNTVSGLTASDVQAAIDEVVGIAGGTPSASNVTFNDTVGLGATNVQAAIVALDSNVEGKADAVHQHVITDVTGLQTALDSKAPTSHHHIIGDVDGLQTALDSKAATSHTHATSEVTGLDAALAAKSDDGHTHVTADVAGLDAALAGKSDTGHTHAIADVTNLQTTLNGKAASVHTHTISNITGLQSALDLKAPVDHEHSADDITSGTLPIARGGTGATSASGARTSLGLGTAATINIYVQSTEPVGMQEGDIWIEV